MSRRIYSFDPPDSFVCGAIGQPGERTFFLQASKGQQVVSVALEKAQVAVLAERLALLLVALREGGVELGPEIEGVGAGAGGSLIEPVVEHFRVGALTLAWDPERERVVIEAQELSAADLEEEEADEDEPLPRLAGASETPAGLGQLGGDAADGPDAVRVLLEPTDARAFVSGAVAVVQAGRPPCPMCGAPLEPSGHFCPRRNGYTH